jgi:hypothetical protein
MNQTLELRGRWTLITGASSGLGVELARHIAKEQGGHVVLVARRRDRLETLAEELRSRYGVRTACVTADLSRPEDVERLFTEATTGRDIHAVILNAGVTYWGEAMKLGWSDFQAMLDTNVTSLVRLSTLFVPYLLERGTHGGLMFVSSVAGLIPVPYQAAYSGTKAFVTSYGQCLAQELRPKGLSVTVFAPGGISTDMLVSAGLSNRFKAGDIGVMSPEACAAHAVRAFMRRKTLYVPGLVNQGLALAARVLPRGFLAQRTAAIYRPES